MVSYTLNIWTIRDLFGSVYWLWLVDLSFFKIDNMKLFWNDDEKDDEKFLESKIKNQTMFQTPV